MVLPSRGHHGQTGFEQHEGQYDDRMFSFWGVNYTFNNRRHVVINICSYFQLIYSIIY